MGKSEGVIHKSTAFFCCSFSFPLVMQKQDQKQKIRESWIRVYEQTGSVSKAARKCGIARSSLHRWIKRFPEEGLSDRSRRPEKLARQKLDDETVNLILEIRDTYNFGKIRICSQLLQDYQIRISPSSIARVLKRYDRRLLRSTESPYPLSATPKIYQAHVTSSQD